MYLINQFEQKGLCDAECLMRWNQHNACLVRASVPVSQERRLCCVVAPWIWLTWCVFVCVCVCTMSALSVCVYTLRGGTVWAPCCPDPDTHTYTTQDWWPFAPQTPMVCSHHLSVSKSEISQAVWKMNWTLVHVTPKCFLFTSICFKRVATSPDRNECTPLLCSQSYKHQKVLCNTRTRLRGIKTQQCREGNSGAMRFDPQLCNIHISQECRL